MFGSADARSICTTERPPPITILSRWVGEYDAPPPVKLNSRSLRTWTARRASAEFAGASICCTSTAASASCTPGRVGSGPVPYSGWKQPAVSAAVKKTTSTQAIRLADKRRSRHPIEKIPLGGARLAGPHSPILAQEGCEANGNFLVVQQGRGVSGRKFATFQPRPGERRSGRKNRCWSCDQDHRPLNELGSCADSAGMRRICLVRSAANAFIDEAGLDDIVRLIDVLEIDHDRACHDALETRQVQRPERLPCGDDDQCMGTAGSTVGALASGLVCFLRQA